MGEAVSESCNGAKPLNERQLLAARLLGCGRKPGQVAEQLGITLQCLGDWRRDPRFREEFERVRSETVEALLQAIALDALEGKVEALADLRSVLRDPESSIRERISADHELLGADAT